ncbi:MAG: hypothetical protein JNL22_10780 [Bacteroidales bacterium]|nr:hypothetical protein [Bacteroidales bacterium]
MHNKKSKKSFSDNRLFRFIFPVFLLMIAALFLSHLPFLKADPDTMVSLNTRGAWTDEGLYTAQLRDYINHGHLKLYNNNGFIVTPGFQLLLLPFFYLFGTDIVVGRLFTLLFTIAVLMLFARDRSLRLPALFYLMLAGFQYHYFQFCHYSMGEMSAINMLLLSLFSLVKFEESGRAGKKHIWLFLAAFFSFLSWAIKIQFAYVVVLVPASLLLKALIGGLGTSVSRKQVFGYFGISVLFTFGLAFLYLLVWYLPHREFFNYILNYETADRFKKTIPDLIGVYRFNFRHLIWVKELWPVIILALLLLIAAILSFVSKKNRKGVSLAMLFAVLWLAVEQHKIAMVYLPTRYFLSLIAAAGMVAAFAATNLFHERKLLIAWILPLIASVFVWNTIQVYNSWQRRTFDIKAVKEYLEKSDIQKDQPVLGIWAYTLASGSEAPTLGIRYNYLNDKNPIQAYKPRLVISEFNQAESDSAWARQGIDLTALSDSVKRFKVWRYDLDFYWIRQK